MIVLSIFSQLRERRGGWQQRKHAELASQCVMSVSFSPCATIPLSSTGLSHQLLFKGTAHLWSLWSSLTNLSLWFKAPAKVLAKSSALASITSLGKSCIRFNFHISHLIAHCLVMVNHMVSLTQIDPDVRSWRKKEKFVFSTNWKDFDHRLSESEKGKCSVNPSPFNWTAVLFAFDWVLIISAESTVTGHGRIGGVRQELFVCCCCFFLGGMGGWIDGGGSGNWLEAAVIYTIYGLLGMLWFIQFGFYLPSYRQLQENDNRKPDKKHCVVCQDWNDKEINCKKKDWRWENACIHLNTYDKHSKGEYFHMLR